MRAVHFLTIGEAPRPDVTPELLDFLGEAARDLGVVEAGVLDGLTRDEVREGVPRAGEMPLVSRLASGEEVVLSESFVERRMVRLVGEVPSGEVAGILCTGPFAGIAERQGLVKAGAAFEAALAGACANVGATSVGMLIPERRQEADARGRVPAGLRCEVAVASPYADPRAGARACVRLREVDVIGLNCLGYGAALEAAAAAATGRPVVLARRALADALRRELR